MKIQESAEIKSLLTLFFIDKFNQKEGDLKHQFYAIGLAETVM